jgi:hypothetical protein
MITKIISLIFSILSLNVITVVSCVEFGKRKKNQQQTNEKKNPQLRRETVSIHIVVILLLFLFLCITVLALCISFSFFYVLSVIAYYRINILRVCCSRFQRKKKQTKQNID